MAIGWGSGFRQRVRLAPLYGALLGAGLAAVFRRSPRSQSQPTGSGVSVVIAERDSPGLLEAALKSAFSASEMLREPVQVIVVVNGAPKLRYDDLKERFGAVEWIFHEAPLGFSAAIERGLGHAAHAWTLLLNNDMILEPAAIAQLAALRHDDVFAIGAQIRQQSANGRREETGFVDWYADDGGAAVYHAPVDDTRAPRPHLCASGGAGLFRTSLLAEYVRDSKCYDPFYWEDVEWGLRAWRDGWRVLFAPAALVDHLHRATVSRFYEPGEVERIVARNRVLFEARQAASGLRPTEVMRRVCDLPFASQRELSRMTVALGTFRARIRANRRPRSPQPSKLLVPDGPSELHSSYSFRLRRDLPSTPGRPRLLVVSPYCVFPPRHGGARRTAELTRLLARDFDVILVNDEASRHDARSFAGFDGLFAVTLVQRRDAGTAGKEGFAARCRSHCHEDLLKAVRDALQRYQPDVVQIEHAELTALSALRAPRERWVLAMHDAVAATDFDERAYAQEFNAALGRYDAVVVCSEEDARLVSHPRRLEIANGAHFPARGFEPSAGFQMLFVGPFRYDRNVDGIRRFVERAYPDIRSQVPEASLAILGGDECLLHDDPLFRQPGIRVVGHRDDVPEWLRQSALTLNPVASIRGSAVKLVESLFEGRVCVSTRDGARGFDSRKFPGLVVVDEIADFAKAIVPLLRDAAERHRLERPDPTALQPYSWDASAGRQARLYRELMDAPDG